MQLLTVLVGHDGAGGGAGVGGDDDAGGVDAADDGGAGAGGAGQGDAAGVKGEVAGVVAEVEARHGGRWVKAKALVRVGVISAQRRVETGQGCSN